MRLVFSSSAEFENWMRQFSTPERYCLYESENGELLLYPLKTSRPITYAYLKTENKETIAKIKGLAKDFGLHIFGVKDLEWADDRAVGVRMKVEE